MKKAIIGILVLFVLMIGGILFVGRTYYPDNIAETSADGGEKRLKTLVVESDSDTVKSASKEVINELSTWGGAWKLIDETDGGAEARLKVEVPVVVFTDDLEVVIKEASAGKVSVDVRSESRVGKSDFGENARHVRQFLDALDDKFKK